MFFCPVMFTKHFLGKPYQTHGSKAEGPLSELCFAPASITAVTSLHTPSFQLLHFKSLRANCCA